MLCKRGLYRHAVSVCPSVCHVRGFCQNELSQTFSPSDSQTILVFAHQTLWRYSDGNLLNGASNAGAVGTNRPLLAVPKCNIPAINGQRTNHSIAVSVALRF